MPLTPSIDPHKQTIDHFVRPCPRFLSKESIIEINFQQRSLYLQSSKRSKARRALGVVCRSRRAILSQLTKVYRKGTNQHLFLTEAIVSIHKRNSKGNKPTFVSRRTHAIAPLSRASVPTPQKASSLSPFTTHVIIATNPPPKHPSTE